MTDQEMNQLIQTLSNSFIALQNVGITASKNNLDMMKMAQNNIEAVLGFLKEKMNVKITDKKETDENKN